MPGNGLASHDCHNVSVQHLQQKAREAGGLGSSLFFGGVKSSAQSDWEATHVPDGARGICDYPQQHPQSAPGCGFSRNEFKGDDTTEERPQRSQRHNLRPDTSSSSWMSDSSSIMGSLVQSSGEGRIVPWNPTLWLDVRQQLIDTGRVKDLPYLMKCVRESSSRALLHQQYNTTQGTGTVDLTAHLMPAESARWLGRRNVKVPQMPDNARSSDVQPPIIVPAESALDVIYRVKHSGSEDDRKRPIIMLLEVSDFDEDGKLNLGTKRTTSMAQQNMLARSDFQRFAEQAAGSLRSARCSVKDHLTAVHDPYVFTCPNMTMFRGGRDDGYPFLATPIHFSCVVTAMQSVRPAVYSASQGVGGAKTQWYSSDVDQTALLERLCLIGYAALQDVDPQQKPILVLSALGCADRGLHPKDAVGNSLKHWRTRFACLFHTVFLACGPDRDLAEHFDLAINSQLYSALVSEDVSNFAEWHWARHFISLHVNNLDFQVLAEMVDQHIQLKNEAEAELEMQENEENEQEALEQDVDTRASLRASKARGSGSILDIHAHLGSIVANKRLSLDSDTSRRSTRNSLLEVPGSNRNSLLELPGEISRAGSKTVSEVSDDQDDANRPISSAKASLLDDFSIGAITDNCRHQIVSTSAERHVEDLYRASRCSSKGSSILNPRVSRLSHGVDGSNTGRNSQRNSSAFRIPLSARVSVQQDSSVFGISPRSDGEDGSPEGVRRRQSSALQLKIRQGSLTGQSPFSSGSNSARSSLFGMATTLQSRGPVSELKFSDAERAEQVRAEARRRLSSRKSSEMSIIAGGVPRHGSLCSRMSVASGGSELTMGHVCSNGNEDHVRRLNVLPESQPMSLAESRRESIGDESVVVEHEQLMSPLSDQAETPPELAPVSPLTDDASTLALQDSSKVANEVVFSDSTVPVAATETAASVETPLIGMEALSEAGASSFREAGCDDETQSKLPALRPGSRYLRTAPPSKADEWRVRMDLHELAATFKDSTEKFWNSPKRKKMAPPPRPARRTSNDARSENHIKAFETAISQDLGQRQAEEEINRMVKELGLDEDGQAPQNLSSVLAMPDRALPPALRKISIMSLSSSPQGRKSILLSSNSPSQAERTQGIELPAIPMATPRRSILAAMGHLHGSDGPRTTQMVSTPTITDANRLADIAEANTLITF